MIFVTVGTQLPFPRLIDAMEAIAGQEGEEVVAQTGAYEGTLQHLDARVSLAPAEFEALFQRARVVVGHAGIGTILSAKRYGKPLVLVPRRHALGEHRNDHQLATARQVENLQGVHIAWEVDDLEGLLSRPDLTPPGDEMSPTHATLVAHLRGVIDG